MDIAIIGSKAKSNWRSMQYIGDNMEPTITKRDYVTIETLETYQGEGIYLMEHMGNISIYRLQHNGHTLTLVSDNERYSGPGEMNLAEFNERVVGRVLGIWKPLVSPGYLDRVAALHS